MAYKEVKALKETWSKEELAVIRGIWASAKKNRRLAEFEPLNLQQWEALVAEKIAAKHAPKQEKQLTEEAQAVYNRVAAIAGITEEQLATAKKSLLASSKIKSKLYDIADAAQVKEYLDKKANAKAHKGERVAKANAPKPVKDFNKVKIAKLERQTLEAIFRKAKLAGLTMDEVVEALTSKIKDKANQANAAEIAALEERLAALKANVMY